MNRWWDGRQWTPHAQPWAAPTRRQSEAWLAIAIGGAAAFVGAFLPWARVILLGTLDLLQLVGHGSDRAVLALLILCAAIVVAIIGVVQRAGPTASQAIAAQAVSIAGAVLSAVWGIVLGADLRHAAGFASLGIGPFVTTGGFVLAAVGAGVMLSRLPKAVLSPGWYERRRGQMSWWDGEHWHDVPAPPKSDAGG